MTVSVLQTTSKFLTPADIIGSTFREARLNWRTTVTIFLVPGFASSFAFYIDNWPISNPTTIGIEVALMTAALVILVLARFAIRLKQFAILLYQSKQATDLPAAIRLAQKKQWLVFLSCWPALLLDATLLLSMHFLLHVLKELPSLQYASALLGTAVCSEIPYQAINLLNLIFVAIFVKENISIWSTCRRFCQLLLHNLGYVVNFMLLFLLVTVLLDLTCMLMLAVPYLLELIPGIPKDSIFIHIAESGLMAVGTSFLSAANTYSCAALYKQMTMRSECSDLIEQLLPTTSPEVA